MVKFNIYVKAFFLSLGIFLVGLFIGMNIENFIRSDLIARASDIESSIQEIELEMLYFQGLNANYSCDFLNEIVRKTNNNLDSLSAQLVNYPESNVLFGGAEAKRIKSKYTFLLIKDWLLQERIKTNCGTKSVSVLYFYKTIDCDDCIVQGDVLSSLKSSFKEKLMIFPLDIRVQLSMMEILMRRYNITSTPSLVMEEKVYRGIVSKDGIKNIICEIFKEENLTECS